MTVERLGSLVEYLERHAREHPAREAAVGEGERLTCAQLDAGVAAIARELTRLGIDARDRVAQLAPPGTAFWAVFLACQRVGAVWVGLNPAYGERELAQVLGDAQPTLVLVDASLAGARAALQAACHAAGLGAPVALAGGSQGALSTLRAVAAVARPAGEGTPAGAALLVYTSGTTGTPKGALISAEGLVENGWWLARRVGEEGGRTLVDLPVNHIGCVGDMCASSLILGNTLVFAARFDAADAVRLVREERVTWTGLVPAQYQLMLSAGGLQAADLASVRCLAWGGAAMPLPLVQRLAQWVPDLFNSYGLTECSGTITITPRGADGARLAGTVGVPVHPERVRIADAEDRPVADGVAGEVQVRGPHVFLGYFRNPAATRAAFTADGWLRTGDVGVLGADGLVLSGRTREMFKSGGYNVYPREVEAVIEAIAGVELCAVVPVADALWGEVGTAYVQGDAARLPIDMLAARCRAQLARYKVPKRFVVLKSLPLLPVGKVDKSALRESAARPPRPSLQESR